MEKAGRVCVPNSDLKLDRGIAIPASARRPPDIKRAPRLRQSARCGTNSILLESQLWSERYTQIVTCPLVKVHLVANIDTYPQASGKAFNTHTRIERETGVAGCHTAQRTAESRGRILIRNAEVNKPEFRGSESAKGTTAELVFGAKEA